MQLSIAHSRRMLTPVSILEAQHACPLSTLRIAGAARNFKRTGEPDFTCLVLVILLGLDGNFAPKAIRAHLELTVADESRPRVKRLGEPHGSFAQRARVFPLAYCVGCIPAVLRIARAAAWINRC